jgi:importin subunit alpha-6/7
MAKRRNMALLSVAESDDATAAPSVPDNSQGATLPSAPTSTAAPSKAVRISDIPDLMRGFQAADVPTQLQSLRGFRRLLSAEKNPPVQQCIDAGAIPLFVQFLSRVDSAELQFEAAWALTNIASTDRTRLVVDYGAVPYLVQLLTHSSADIREQSGWCLGNIAGDGAELRDHVLGHGALMPLVANVTQPASVSLLRNLTWSLSNFCRGKPQPPLAQISAALPALANILYQNSDQESIIDATWALSYISDGDNARIQAVVDLNVIPYLVQMLASGLPQAIVPALRTLGNIVSGNDSQTQAVVNANVLPAVVPLLTHAKKNIRKEACWLLSNIAAGNPNQLSQLVGTPDLLSRVLQQLSASAEWDVRKEAAWVVSNIATGGKPAHIAHLVEQGAVQPLCELLTVGEVRILMLAMEALESVLKLSTKPEVLRSSRTCRSTRIRKCTRRQCTS